MVTAGMSHELGPAPSGEASRPLGALLAILPTASWTEPPDRLPQLGMDRGCSVGASPPDHCWCPGGGALILPAAGRSPPVTILMRRTSYASCLHSSIAAGGLSVGLGSSGVVSLVCCSKLCGGYFVVTLPGFHASGCGSHHRWGIVITAAAPCLPHTAPPERAWAQEDHHGPDHSYVAR
jgi:hypothetical protein